jgi:hypothetical protein
MKDKRRINGQLFILAEVLSDRFDAHDAAHTYRHEGWLCRTQQLGDNFLVWVGGSRLRSIRCDARWCPYNEAPSSQYYQPSKALKLIS